MAVRSPIGWTPLTDTTDKETNERTDGWMDVSLFVGPFVRSSLRWSLTHNVNATSTRYSATRKQQKDARGSRFHARYTPTSPGGNVA